MKEFLFLGDSITDCDHSFDKDNLGNGYVRIISENLYSHSAEIKMKNMGRDGFTIPAVNRLWNLCCKKMTPCAITILIGINDVSVMKCSSRPLEVSLQEFQKNYESLLETIKADSDCPLLLSEPFIFSYPEEYASWDPLVHQISGIIQNIAKSHNVAFLPLWDKLNLTVKRYGFNAVTTDGIHLTAKGHQIIAESWLEWYAHQSQVKNK